MGSKVSGEVSKLISEAALCLAQQVDRRMAPGGVWTPGAAMGLVLAERLQARAGLTFSLIDPPAPESKRSTHP